MHRLTINAIPGEGFDNGTFRIQFQSPDLKRVISDEMKTNMSGSQIRDALKKYFSTVNLNTVVTRKDLDAND